MPHTIYIDNVTVTPDMIEVSGFLNQREVDWEIPVGEFEKWVIANKVLDKPMEFHNGLGGLQVVDTKMDWHELYDSPSEMEAAVKEYLEMVKPAQMQTA